MITFKEIDMTGFKSFADPTKINFDGGITAIVGPNGCGKSNVADAIRWVLGEQSSKSLRGKSMQDVIFAGTEKRKHLSYCEVSLVFDNTHKWFKVDYDEVVITRKLYRSGESEYYLNRNLCRLKDITDLLYDSGVGKDGYSIIGQGKVEEIISSKPEDRRSIFEEAAGIAKFKARKVESERKLERYRENMARLNDIMTEIERRLGPLKKQCEDAKKYLELRDTLKDLEVNAYIYQYENASSVKEDINIKRTGYADNLNIKQKELDSLQAKYDANMNEINNIDKSISDLRDKVLNLTVELEKKQGEHNLLNERLSHIKEQVDRISNDIRNLELDMSQRKALLDMAVENRAKEQENLRIFNLKSDELSNAYLEIVDNITKSEGEKEESQRAYIDNITKLSDIKSNMSALKAKKETILENLSQDKQKQEKLLQNKAQLSQEIESYSKEVNSFVNKKNELEKTLATNKQNSIDIESRLIKINEDLFTYKTAITNDVNRKNLLVSLQANFEGYQFAVKRLLNDSKSNINLKNAISGVVGNVIQVKDLYQTAIEIALGNSIQNIITKDEHDAKILINYLKDYKLGRATFLPVSAVKPRYLSQHDRSYLNGKGCIGVASEIISFPEEYRPVIESLLGGTVVVDNLDNAVNLAKASNYAFKIVSLEGDVLSPQGSMSGGSKKQQDSSLLGKENEIKLIEQNIAKNTEYLKQIEKEHDSLNMKNIALKEQNEKLATALQEFNANYGSKLSKMQSLKDNLDNVEMEIRDYENQIAVANNFIKEIDERINSVDSLENNITTNQQQVNAYNTNTQSAYEKLKSKREEYNQEMTTLKVNIASSEEKIKALNIDIDRYTKEIEDTKQNIANVSLELNRHTEIYNTAMNMQKDLVESSESKEINREIRALNEKLDNYGEYKSSILNEIKDLDEQKGSIQNDIARLQNRIFQEDARLQKVDTDIQNMQDRIYEEYEMTYNDCIPFKKAEFDIKEAMIAISRTKAHITQLGYVNVGAIEEYKSEGARYEEMSGQMTDLKNAENDLVKVINDLSTEMLNRFNVEFDKINANFTKVFKELFGGGNAKLVLLPNEDPLSAGVEILAQPPGKNVPNLSALSGGEKTMTAIAILFAILKLRPMPFCFLDEIEAALDDANIERYARYLQRFSQETQFIVITHRKPTMELADALFGVTMEEKGVSKIVSVKLSDAVKVVNEDKNKE